MDQSEFTADTFVEFRGHCFIRVLTTVNVPPRFANVTLLTLDEWMSSPMEQKEQFERLRWHHHCYLKYFPKFQDAEVVAADAVPLADKPSPMPACLK